MATRGFSCPNCHTWFEGQGSHPKCPLCGTRASPSDLLEAHQPGASPPAEASPWALPDYETPAPPPDYEEAPDYKVPAPVSGGEQPRRSEGAESWGNRLSPLIGALVFILIIASQVCRSLTESG
jgi:hypothetical protein